MENNEISTTVNLNFDTIRIENLLLDVQKVNNFEEITIWDKNAILEKENIEKFITQLDFAYQNIQNQILDLRGKNVFSYLIGKSKILKRNKGFLSQHKNIKSKLINYSGNLEYWINLTPNSKEELNEMKIELKEKKQLYNIRKKELNIIKKDIQTLYRVNNANVEFSSPKLRHMFRGINMKNREDNLSPFNQEYKNIELQLIEFEKIIIWLNKIK